MASEGSGGPKRARCSGPPKPRQGGLAAAIQRYIKESQLPPQDEAPADCPAHQTSASDSSAASTGQRQQARQAQQAQQRQQAQHVLPVVGHSQDAPNLYLQQSGGGLQGGAAPQQGEANRRAGGAIAAAIAAEIASGQAPTPVRKRSRPPKAAAAAAAAASAASEPPATSGGSSQQRRGNGGSGSATKIRLRVGSRARVAADSNGSDGEEEQVPLPRPRVRRRAAPPPPGPVPQGGGDGPPHGCNMVLLSQLHATLPADLASTRRLQQRRQGAVQQQQVQAALRALEQAPRSPVLSPLQILMLESGSGPVQSPLPLSSVGMIPLLQLPPGAVMAPGQTPLAAALLPAEIDDMLDGGDFTLEGLLGPLPTSPYLPPAASLTPVVTLPGMAASPPATAGSSAKPQAGRRQAGGLAASPLPLHVLAAVPVPARGAAGRRCAAAGGQEPPQLPATTQQQQQQQQAQLQQEQAQAQQQQQQQQQAQQHHAQQAQLTAARGTPRAVHLTPLVAPFLLSPSMALLSPLAVEQWLQGDGNNRS